MKEKLKKMRTDRARIQIGRISNFWIIRDV